MKHDLTFQHHYLQYALPTVGDKWLGCFAYLGMPYHSANQLLGCEVSCVGQTFWSYIPCLCRKCTVRSKTSSQIPFVQYHVDSRLVFEIASCFVSFHLFINVTCGRFVQIPGGQIFETGP